MIAVPFSCPSSHPGRAATIRRRHYVLVSKTSTWKLIRGLSMIVASMCTPWLSFLSGAYSATGLIMTIIGSVGAGAAALQLWSDKELTEHLDRRKKSLHPSPPDETNPPV